jgi:hypothetical protein
MTYRTRQLAKNKCQFRIRHKTIKDKSAASFCHHVEAWVLQMFDNFILKKFKNANNTTTTQAREKISTDLESIEFSKNFDVCVTKFKIN